MEQRKVNAKDIFLLLGSIGAAFGVNFGIALIGGMIITIYFVAVHGYNVEEVMQLVVSPGITMKLSCVMHASFILIFGIW